MTVKASCPKCGHEVADIAIEGRVEAVRAFCGNRSCRSIVNAVLR